MGKYNFDEVIDRRGTRSTKWDSGKVMLQYGMTDRFDEETIPVFTADMDFACPPQLVSALEQTVKRRIYGYTMPESDGIYYKTVADWHERKYGWKFAEDSIVYVNGTLNAIVRGIRSFSNEGDGIIIQKPVYAPFQMFIESCGRKVVDNHLKKNSDGYYEMDYEDLESKMSEPKNTMMLLCSPHNPVGRVWKKEELSRVCALCKKYDVTLLSDEMHADLIRKEQKFYPTALFADGCRLLTCTGISKTFNVAGLQCTNVIIEEEGMRNRFQKDLTAETGVVTPNVFTIEATISAYAECSDWLEAVKEYIDQNIDFALEFIKTKMPKVKCRRPEGTYMLWMDFQKYGSKEEVWKKIVVNANVMADPGEKYGEEGYVRMCLALPRSVLKEALERICLEFK